MKNLFSIYAKPGIYLSHVRILGTHDCGKEQRNEFQRIGSSKD